MSTLNVANVTDGTLTVPTTSITEGTARAWCSHSFPTTINESFNTSSVEDLGTGIGKMNYTNAMANSLPVILANTNGGAHNTTFLFLEVTLSTTSKHEYNMGTSTHSTNTLGDHPSSQCLLGDLA